MKGNEGLEMIRLAKYDDIDEMMNIYAIARQFMREHGNPYQWGNGNPSRALIEEDVEKGYSHIYEVDGKMHGVFVFQFDIDEVYNYIEGSWLNEEPYAAIHRVASDGETRGFFTTCVEYCKEKAKEKNIRNLKIDTHECNVVMQHVVKKNGFQHCGTIYLSDGKPRMGFQYVEGEH